MGLGKRHRGKDIRPGITQPSSYIWDTDREERGRMMEELKLRGPIWRSGEVPLMKWCCSGELRLNWDIFTVSRWLLGVAVNKVTGQCFSQRTHLLSAGFWGPTRCWALRRALEGQSQADVPQDDTWILLWNQTDLILQVRQGMVFLFKSATEIFISPLKSQLELLRLLSKYELLCGKVTSLWYDVISYQQREGSLFVRVFFSAFPRVFMLWGLVTDLWVPRPLVVFVATYLGSTY